MKEIIVIIIFLVPFMFLMVKEMGWKDALQVLAFVLGFLIWSSLLAWAILYV